MVILYCANCVAQEKNNLEIINRIKKTMHYINNNINEYSKREKDVFGESSEGGVLLGYYEKGKLKKVSASIYGESGKTLSDYYVDDSGLYFVKELSYFYNMPMYVKGSKIVQIQEFKFYFNKNEIIQWDDSKDSSYIKKNDELLDKSRELNEDVIRYKKILGAFLFKEENNIYSDTVRCKFKSFCPSSGYILKGSRDSTGRVIHVFPTKKNVLDEN